MNKKIWTTTIIIALLVFGFFVFKDDEQAVNNKKETTREENKSRINVNVTETEVEKISEETNSFYHPLYGFSLNFSSDMKNSNFVEGEGEQILFQDDTGKWFQIYITPWDEGDNLSVSRIKEDLPNLPIENPQEVILGHEQKDGVGPRALIFWSRQDGLGETREVWFVQQGFLYQITTFKRLDTFLAETLATLTFGDE